MSYRFRVSTNLRVGAGESAKLGEELADLGFARPAAIMDASLVENPVVRAALAGVEGKMPLAVFSNTAREPDYDFLQAFFGKNLKGTGFDVLIGVGGGSTMDLAKGAAVLMTNAGAALSFRGFPKLSHRPAAVVALPTTAGTGSEVTYNAVFTDSQGKKKLGINSPQNFPVAAIIDPLLLAGAPRAVALSSGADALVHTLESFVHKNHTAVSRPLSAEAFRLLFGNFAAALDDPKNHAAWEAMGVGAYLAGLALMNAGSGPSGALSYPLGVHHEVPHGLAGAVFLPAVTRYNIRKGYRDYARLYDVIEGADRARSDLDKSAAFGDALEGLWRKLGLPLRLSALKLAWKDVDFLAEQYDVLKAAIDQNPVPFSKEDLRRMLQEIA